MSETSTSLNGRPQPRPRIAIGATALLVACGGGGDAVLTAGTATPTSATTYTQGVISGFGSIIVGGVRYDDTWPRSSTTKATTATVSELRLGMVVEVDAGNVDRPAASARALQIRWGSEIVGPVGPVDTAASTVEVLGQTVLVTSSTVFDETLAGGLTALRAGDVVEVHGILDPANGRIVATRIEAEAGATAYKLRGPIADLDTTARTFTIGGERDLLRRPAGGHRAARPGQWPDRARAAADQRKSTAPGWRPRCAAACACPTRTAKPTWKA